MMEDGLKVSTVLGLNWGSSGSSIATSCGGGGEKKEHFLTEVAHDKRENKTKATDLPETHAHTNCLPKMALPGTFLCFDRI